MYRYLISEIINAKTRDLIPRPNLEGSEKSNLLNGNSQNPTTTIPSSVCTQASTEVKYDTQKY